MLSRLGDAILSFRVPRMNPFEFFITVFSFFAVLSAFLLVSRRMNARLEAAAPAPRRLPQLARALSAMKDAPQEQTNVFVFFLLKIERPLVWLLRKTDWLVHDKLKLLPDAKTGRRLNYFAMLYADLLVTFLVPWFGSDDNISYRLTLMRNGALSYRPTLSEQTGAIWLLLLWALFSGVLFMLPFLLLRKNREFYYDFFATVALMTAGFCKVIYCWRDGCCFGIPCRWGIYSGYLETTVFPVQLLEAAAFVAAALLCILYMQRAKSYRPGYGCSFCLSAFMVLRFFTEYLRYHGEGYRPAEATKILGMSQVHILCIFGCVLAVAWALLLPLEKKLLDRFRLIVARPFRKLASKFARAAGTDR